jgi:hypothetical protein
MRHANFRPAIQNEHVRFAACCAFGIYVISLWVLQGSFAGDVVYTMWEDENENVWVRFENHTESVIRIQEILIVFYDVKGRPVGDRKVACTEQCRVASRDVRDFGPFSTPESYHSARVRNVKYAVE